MNKKTVAGLSAVAVAAAVAAAYLGATAYLGQQFRKAYEARFEKLEKDLPSIKIVDRKVETSLFRSTYSAKVQVGCALTGDKNSTFVFGLVDQVSHGPLPGFSHVAAALVDSRIVLPESAPQALRQYVDGLPQDAIRTEIGFQGGYSTAVHLPAGQIAGSKGTASWPAFAMTGNGRIDGSATRFDAKLPAFEFVLAGDKGARIQLTGIHMQGDTHGGGSSLWLREGTSAMDIESLEVHADADSTPITARLTNLRYATEVTGAQDLRDGKVALSTDASLQLGRDAKPFTLDKVELVESFKRLHAPTLESFVTASMQSMPGCEDTASKSTPAQADEDEPDDEGAASEALRAAQSEKAKAMLQGLLALLPHDPEFSVDRIGFGYGGRRGELAYSVGVKGFKLQPGETVDEAQPRLIEALTVKAHMSLPAPWVEQLSALAGDEASAGDRAMQAKMLVEMGLSKKLIVRKADDITSELLFEHGVTTLNGKPFGR